MSCPVAPVLVRWPGDAERRASLAGSGTPCLLVIEPGAPVPPLGAHEDWIDRRADERDVAARLERLGRLASASVARAAVLVPLDLEADPQRVATVLLGAIGRLVPRADVDVDDLDAVLPAVEAALGPLGFALIAVGDAGLLLEPERT